MADEANETFDETTKEKLDYDSAMKLVDESKAYITEVSGKQYLHVYSEDELAFFEENRKAWDKKELEPTASELSDSAVEISGMASDNEAAIVELGEYISELETRIKALEDAQNG